VIARLRSEDGFVGGMEALPFGFLVFVAGTLLLVNAWGVFDSHLAAGAAAREAVRAFVESDGDGVLAGEAAADEALEGHGKDVERADLRWTPSSPLLERCAPVTAEVTYRVPLIAVPWIGAFGGGFIETTAHHTEVVDPYRSGLPVDGGCGG
jgi:hypothetical protein